MSDEQNGGHQERHWTGEKQAQFEADYRAAPALTRDDLTEQEREAMEAAYRRDTKPPCGPLSPSSRTWHREGFESGYRAALASSEAQPQAVADLKYYDFGLSDEDAEGFGIGVREGYRVGRSEAQPQGDALRTLLSAAQSAIDDPECEGKLWASHVKTLCEDALRQVATPPAPSPAEVEVAAKAMWERRLSEPDPPTRTPWGEDSDRDDAYRIMAATESGRAATQEGDDAV